VRVAPGEIGDLAVDLGHRLHVEAADEAVVSAYAEGEPEHGDRDRRARRSRPRGASIHQRGLRNTNSA
jgi:hypothetical protein